MTKPKVGLLPLYLELYDNVMPSARGRMQSFYDTIAEQLENRGVEVVKSPICRLEPEFRDALRLFEDANAQAIVTLHLAYSPSLESAHILAGTELPVIVLDTTPNYDFSPRQNYDEMMYNHGIHGVQDLCSVLLRYEKPFHIEAGHWEKSDVLDRVAAWARAAHLSSVLRAARVGRIGNPFHGMGDFALSAEVLDGSIGIATIEPEFSELAAFLPSADDPAVLSEMEMDKQAFTLADNVDTATHISNTRVGLALRKWIVDEKLTAFTMNFDEIGPAVGLPTVPFLEASKSIARGIGYAGEGDVLTAAFVGALASCYRETTFTEMFCPDWEHESIYLSHMGEFNINLAESKPVLTRKALPWLYCEDPIIAIGRFKGGEAVWINVAPGPNDIFTLILAPVTVIPSDGVDGMTESVRGWIKPRMPISDFLAAYSELGGTHHAAMVYGDVVDDMIRFGEIQGWQVAVLG